jgi:hypothetical protein
MTEENYFLDQEFQRYRQTADQAIELRNQAQKYWEQKNYKAVLDNCQNFLRIVENLPKGYIEVYGKPGRDHCGDVIIATATIFDLLYYVYLREEKGLEALACIQKMNKILSKYKPGDPKKFIGLPKYQEYQSLVTYINEIFTAENSNLKQRIEECQKAGFLNEKLEVNEEAVKQRYPNVDSENLDKIKKYSPFVFEKVLVGIKLSEVSSGCFIATAAYSTSTHTDLDTFRNFRDEKLLTNPVGKQLVNIYYQISPSIAKYVEKQPAIKSFVRKQLERLAESMR